MESPIADLNALGYKGKCEGKTKVKGKGYKVNGKSKGTHKGQWFQGKCFTCGNLGTPLENVRPKVTPRLCMKHPVMAVENGGRSASRLGAPRAGAVAVTKAQLLACKVRTKICGS